MHIDGQQETLVESKDALELEVLSFRNSRYAAGFCGVALIAVGALSFVGWFTRDHPLASVPSGCVPMAPLSAVGFLLLGSSLLLLTLSPRHGYLAARLCAACVALIAIWRLAEVVTGADLGTGLFIAKPLLASGECPTALMAIPTVLSFFAASQAIIFLGSRRAVAFGLALAVTLIGLAFALGYMYGRPLLYRTGEIPMALSTALAFCAFGIGLALLAMIHELAVRQLLHRERERLYNEVQRHDEFLRVVLDQMPGGVLAVEATTREIVIANRQLDEAWRRQISSMALYESLDRTDGLVPDGQVTEPAHSALMRALLDGETVRDETTQIVRADGTVGYERVNAAPIVDADGKTIAAIVATLDVTDIMEAQEELRRQRDQMQALNQELESFSYSVSHDLRAPLRAVDGFSQAILEDYGDRLDPEGLRYLQRLRAAGRRMGELIEDLLQLSRVTREPMRWEPLDLSDIARTVVEQLQATDPERNVEFRLPESLPATGHPRLLHAALTNLLGNAWKFTSKKPAAIIEFGSELVDGEVTYYVRDNGAGFDMAYADKLFTPFQRLHAISEFEGNGIGLAIVKRVVTLHGGRVWAHGETGHGASFGFTLSDSERGEQ